VLVVDDNIINQKIASSMLQKLGCSVEVEENGRAALNRFMSSKKPYDAIFMDVQMPQMYVTSTRLCRSLNYIQSSLYLF
jgi:CheY-like chemotaxis protein